MNRVFRVFAGLMLTASLAAFCSLALPAVAGASTGQIGIIQDDPLMLSDPAGTLAAFRALGATTVRVIMHWYNVAPDPASSQMPAQFDPSDPASYSPSSWAPYDQMVKDASQAGITVDFTVAGGAPAWAEGSGIPPRSRDPSFAWKPSAEQYGEFVHAVGERYDGQFTPQGASSPLPAVHFWALWNEPNFGQDLGPQAIDGSTVSVAPMMYRGLVNAGWSALAQTGHSHDTILIGEFAAQGQAGRVTRAHPQGLPGDYGQTKPLQFIRTLYCLGTTYKQLRGGFASARGCPTNEAGSRRFRAQNQGLFNASGVGDHPYPGARSPVDDVRVDPDFAAFPELGNLEHVLDRVTRVYGAHKRYSIYSDEYGYITRPPAAAPYVSPTTAAYYLNWSEYLSWKSSRVASYAQYLLEDPPPATNAGFTSGLLTDLGNPKPTYAAYRLPLYLPSTSLTVRRATEVWGDVRPAYFMNLDTQQAQTVAIQLQKAGHGPFTTVKTVTVANTNGYFDVHARFKASVNVRLAYTYPQADPFLPVAIVGTTVTSRVVKIKLH